MTKDDRIPGFSLFGGPLHQLGCRAGLVKEMNTTRLGLALGFLAWGVLIVLSFFQGILPKIFTLTFIGVHARFLLAIPLFFLCETLVAPRMAEFVRSVVRSGVVPDSELPRLSSDIRKIGRIKNSWLVEVLFLLVVFVSPLLEMVVDIPGRTGSVAWIIGQGGGSLTFVQGWYLGFCLPLFRFLMLRWLWHLGLWGYFLWRLEKIKLQLIPTHPDAAGGLGYLEVVHEYFLPLVLAFSVVLSASFTENIFSGVMAFETLYRLVPLVFLLVGFLFLGPLFIFSRKLLICRTKGLDEYMVMAAHYVSAFDRKWIRDETATGEAQLGTADMQSLADLMNSVNAIGRIRVIPAGERLLKEITAAVIVPLLPLVFLKYPVDQVAVRLFQMISGQ